MINIKKVLELIVNMTQNVLKSESAKQNLNSHERCEGYALFSRIDREDKGYIIKEDLVRFLNDNGVNIDPQRKTIDLFIEYYDRDFDEKLNFTEFLNFIFNKEQNLSRSMTSQRETYKIACDEFLDKDLESLTVEALLSDFYLFEYADMKKIELFLNLENNNEGNSNYTEDNKLIDLFIEMDNDKNGLISCDDLICFVNKRKIKICPEELQSFIGIYDEDMDGCLDWNEFILMILPSASSFEYDLPSLQKQEEKYYQFYEQNTKTDLSENNYMNNKNMNQYNFNYSNVQCSPTIFHKPIANKNKIKQNKNYTNEQLNNNPESDNVNYEQSMFENKRRFGQTNNNDYYESSTNNFSGADFKYQFDELSQILFQIIDFEKNIENLRCKLISDPSFNLFVLFDYFDRYKNGYISFVDFQEGLESLDINNKNSLLLFSKYDTSNNGRLTKEGFFSMFLPNGSSSPEINSINDSSSKYNNDNFQNYIKNCIVQLLSYLIVYMTFLSNITNLYQDRGLNIEYIFSVLDKQQKGYIEENEFGQIFKYGGDGKGIPIDDLLLIMEKIDSDKDGKITLQDFIDLFS